MVADEGLLSCVHNLSGKVAESEYTEMDIQTFRTFTAGAGRLPASVTEEDIQQFIAVLVSFIQKKDEIEFGSYCVVTLLTFLREDEKVFAAFRPRP